jgi:hypothetical protein
LPVILLASAVGSTDKTAVFTPLRAPDIGDGALRVIVPHALSTNCDGV